MQTVQAAIGEYCPSRDINICITRSFLTQLLTSWGICRNHDKISASGRTRVVTCAGPVSEEQAERGFQRRVGKGETFRARGCT